MRIPPLATAVFIGVIGWGSNDIHGAWAVATILLDMYWVEHT